MPRVRYRTQSKQVLNIFRELERSNTTQFSAINPGTAKSLRSLEQRMNRVGEDVLHLFYDSRKQKGIVQCFATPKVRNDTIYLWF